MPAGAPGASSRGRGGKFRKTCCETTGGKHFSRNLQPLDSEGNAVSMWGEDAQLNKDEDDSEEESEEESDEESDEEEEAGGSKSAAAQLAADANREDRKAQKKARKEAAIAKQKSRVVEVGDMPSSSDDDNESDAGLPANPNHSSSARKQASKAATAGVDAITEGVKKLPASRREREAAEAAAAKERYMKLHAEGKTDEAKADIARLKAIRAQREADAARRQAEKEEKEERERERRAEIEAREAKLRALAAGPKKSSKKK
ncbi:casein kinase substrate phosphoprotein PP28 domain-containing protein [Trichoderma aethiopicum]